MSITPANLIRWSAFCSALVWAASAEGRTIQGIQTADNDHAPGIGFEWVGVGSITSYQLGVLDNNAATDDMSLSLNFEKYKTTITGSSPTPTPGGGWAIDSIVDLNYEFDFQLLPGGELLHITGNGNAHMIGTAPAGEPRVFDTEMLSLDLSGILDGVTLDPDVPFLFRESPTQASTGKATLTSLPRGQYQFDSFFDVFTEISINGGQTWIAGARVPEPPGMALVVLGGLALLRIRRYPQSWGNGSHLSAQLADADESSAGAKD